MCVIQDQCQRRNIKTNRKMNSHRTRFCESQAGELAQGLGYKEVLFVLEISSCGLVRKYPSQAPVFEHSVPSRWCHLRRMWSLEEGSLAERDSSLRQALR